VGAFYYKTFWYLGGIIFSIMALLSIPNQKVRDWFINSFKKLLYLILALVILGITIWLGGKMLKGIGNLGKYEGQTAKEWYYDYADAEDRYQEFRNCVEVYDNFDIRTQLDYGGVFYYCE